MISSTIPDWQREKIRKGEWHPAKRLLAVIRSYQYHSSRLYGVFAYYHKLFTWFCILKHRFWTIVTGADIPLNSSIGGGLLLPHSNGVVINPYAVIGPNCLFMSQVVIGTRGGKGHPKIGGHVDVGSGAKILGDVVIGDHVQIGANAVVITDIPANSVAVGIPAKVLKNCD